MELLRAADILIEKIKRDYRDDVACVVVMGSYIYNATHSRSDLDMYFVLNTERGENLGMSFIIDGIGFDFWPISWERLERIANHDERITSIVTEGRMLYYSSEEDLERFNQLKSKALDVRDSNKFINKAQAKLNESYKSYFKLQDAENLSEARSHAMGIIFSLTYSIALVNRDTVKRGRGKLKKEIMDMPLVPKDFASLYDAVFISKDIAEIKSAYRELIKNTEELILSQQSKEREVFSFADRFNGYYEEMINFYNKIYHSCETGDIYTALFAAVELTREFEDFALGTEVSSSELPDIIGAFDPENTEKFLQLVNQHQAQSIKLLKDKGVKIREFSGFDELEKYMEQL